MRRLLPLVFSAALGACAYNGPGTAPSAFDGTYQGTVNNIHVGANSCPSNGQNPGSLNVQNGSVMWMGAGQQMYAPIMKDGSFASQITPTGANSAIFFSGKITNRAMVARSSTGGCHQIYDLQRQA